MAIWQKRVPNSHVSQTFWFSVTGGLMFAEFVE